MSGAKISADGLPSVAVVAIARLENRYLEEWVRHHRAVGVSEFYVFCNAGAGEPRASEVLRGEEFGDCAVISHPFARQQTAAYSRFVRDYLPASKADWFFFIDVDEFVVPVEHGCVRRLLSEKGVRGGSLALNWRMFDGNGRLTRPAGGVRENYTRSVFDRHVKCACSREALAGAKLIRNVHNILGHATALDGSAVLGSTFARDLTDIARVNHYFTKSLEELREKCARGRADTGEARDFEAHRAAYHHMPAAVEDTSALRYVGRGCGLSPRYAKDAPSEKGDPP